MKTNILSSIVIALFSIVLATAPVQAVDNEICQSISSIKSTLKTINQYKQYLANSRGLGIELEGVVAGAVGARGFGTLEALGLGGKLSLYCAKGGGVLVGAGAGVSASLTAIQSIGCQKSSDYAGYFSTLSFSGTFAPLEIGGGVSIGLNLSVLSLYQLLTSLSYNMPLPDLKTRIALLMSDAIRYYFTQRYAYGDITLRLLQRTISAMSAGQLKQMLKDYVAQNNRLNNNDRLILNFLIDRFSGCNSISAELGLAAEESVAGGLSLSYYLLLDDTLTISDVTSGMLDQAVDVVDRLCHGSLPTMAQLRASTSLSQLAKTSALKTMLNLARNTPKCLSAF